MTTNVQAPLTPSLQWTSAASDIYPDFSWVTVTDPDTGPANIEYEIQIVETSGMTTVGSHMYELHMTNGQYVTVSWMSGLTTGSYQARMKAYDGVNYSGESDVTFIIKTNPLLPDDVIIKAPPYVDPYLDTVRFWDKATQGIYNAAKHTGAVVLSL